VALYITQGPTPLLEKTAPSHPLENGEERTTQDPNRVLQSGVPMQPFEQETSKTNAITQLSDQSGGSPIFSPLDILNGKGVTGTARRQTASAQASAVKKAQMLSGDSATRNANIPLVNDTGSVYFLQIGAYKSAADAQQQRARLGLQGLQAKVTARAANGLTLYRVRLGPYARFQEMRRVRQQLAENGIDTAMIRAPKERR
jgi:cell division protein FtsN